MSKRVKNRRPARRKARIPEHEAIARRRRYLRRKAEEKSK